MFGLLPQEERCIARKPLCQLGEFNSFSVCVCWFICGYFTWYHQQWFCFFVSRMPLNCIIGSVLQYDYSTRQYSLCFNYGLLSCCCFPLLKVTCLECRSLLWYPFLNGREASALMLLSIPVYLRYVITYVGFCTCFCCRGMCRPQFCHSCIWGAVPLYFSAIFSPALL